jgi:transposase
MTRPSREPLRALANEERETLEKVVRSRSEAAEVVARAKSLLAVAAGADFAAGAKASGRKSRDGVRKLVQRFNRDGVKALQTKAGAGCPATYTPKQRALILAEFRRPPDREVDGTGTWSLTTLQRALRRRPGLEKIGRETISGVLHAAGLTWQRDRTWCETGVSVRKSKHGKRIVVDADAEPKKT